jgi:tetratricopeptide (TPR) repeat protein
MAEARRSPFGELLKRYRDGLGLTQEELADKIVALNRRDPAFSPVTERTIAGLERRASPARWRHPHAATVRTLARVLQIEPGSPQHDAFIEAATRTGEARRAPVGEPDPGKLASLPPEARRLLLAASVQGATFWAEPLLTILGLSAEAWMDLVDERLVRRARVLVPAGTVTIDADTIHVYAFADPALRDELYGEQLSDLERSWHHRAIAEALVTRFGEEHHDATATIARHFELGHDRPRAARAHLHAGVPAMVARAFDRAAEHFRRVGALGARRADPATYIQSIIGLGNCARGTGDRAEARRQLERALALATRHDLAAIRANALESLALLDFDAGDMEAGARRLAAVVTLWLETGSAIDAARALANQSYLLYGMAEYDRATLAASRSAEMAVDLGDDAIWIDAQLALGICRLDIGHYDAAREIFAQALELAVEIGDAHREQLCRYNLSIAAFEQGQWATARDEARRIVSAHPDRATPIVAAAELNLGIVAEGVGDAAAARAHYERSRRIREERDQRALLIDSLAGLLRVAVTEGRREETSAMRAEIDARIAERGLEGIEHPGRLFVTLIEASLALDDAPSARDHTRLAVTILNDRAARLDDLAHRRSYLDDVPSHRRILDLATELGVIFG